jgi:hypothetical protein
MNRYIFPFEKLDVWQMAVDLAETVLSFLEELPPGKHVRLIGQMEAAATSPAQNIAEGEGRRKLFSEEQTNEVRNRCEAIDRKLNGLINSLHGKRTNVRV